MKKFDVVVFGRSCVDYISVVKIFPKEDMKTPLEFRLIEAGGQGSTSSCCISKLGGKIAYIGKLGDDKEGKFCLKRLKDFGLKTKFVEIVKNGKTPVAYIFVTKSNGKRTIIYEPYTLPKIKINGIMKNLLSNTKTVLLDPEVTYLGNELISLVDNSAKIIYDCERWRDGIIDIMNVSDFFIPTSDFLDSIELNFGNISFSRKMLRLKEMLKGELIVTNGEDGAYYLYNDRLYHVPVPDVDVKDTIGAGDNFHAAFAYAISRGCSLPESVKFSVAVASLSCREYGGRNGIPNLDEVIDIAADIDEKAMDFN